MTDFERAIAEFADWLYREYGGWIVEVEEPKQKVSEG